MSFSHLAGEIQDGDHRETLRNLGHRHHIRVLSVRDLPDILAFHFSLNLTNVRMLWSTCLRQCRQRSLSVAVCATGMCTSTLSMTFPGKFAQSTVNCLCAHHTLILSTTSFCYLLLHIPAWLRCLGRGAWLVHGIHCGSRGL